MCKFMGEVRAVGFSLDSGCTWRFARYKCFPVKWVTLVHPGASKKKKADTVQDFYSLCDCCRTKHLFGGRLPNAPPTAAKLKQDEPFTRLISARAISGCATGMSLRTASCFHSSMLRLGFR